MIGQLIAAALVAVAGGVGAASRFAVDGVLRTRIRTAFPLGTFVVNVTGSFALGVLAGLVAGHLLPPQWGPIAGTGFLGGYTTFSTAAVECVRLFQAQRYRAAVGTALGMLLASVAAAGVGLWLGSL